MPPLTGFPRLDDFLQAVLVMLVWAVLTFGACVVLP